MLRAPSPDAADFAAALRRAGLRSTRPRALLVRALAGDATHPTAQTLFARLRAGAPGASFATVYNTLEALRRAGLCHAVSLAPGPCRFDPNVAPHDHACCDGCGALIDVARPRRDAGPVRGTRPRVPGFEVRAVERVYRGLCEACRRRTGRRRSRTSQEEGT